MPKRTRSHVRQAKEPKQSGILRLPDELLAEITACFIRLHPAVADPFDFSHPRPTSKVYEWIKISHVCTRWRTVVIESTRLWSAIRITASPAWAKTLLDRSGQSVLTVTEDPSTVLEGMNPGKELLLKEIERIQHLQLNVDAATCDVLTALASQNVNAPVLETLRLHCIRERWHCVPSLPLLSDIALPHLRHLSFHDRPDERKSRAAPAPSLKLIKPLLRPSLTHLCIHRLDDPISVEACLQILRTLPKLEDLTLGDVLAVPGMIPGPPSKKDLLHLPQLHTIALEGNCLWDSAVGRNSVYEVHDTGVAAADLLRHLVVPSTADIFVAMGHELYHEATEGETLFFTFNTLRDVAAGCMTAVLGPSRRAITSCHVNLFPLTEKTYQNNNSFELCVDLMTADSNPENDVQPGDPIWPRKSGSDSSLRFRLRSDGCALGQSIHGIFVALEPVLKSVRSLYWECDMDHLTGTLAIGRAQIHGIWEGMFGSMTAIEDLVIDGSAASCVEWLLDEDEHGYTFEDVRPILPHLRTLTVDGAKDRWCPSYIYSWETPSEYQRRTPYYDDRSDLTGVLLRALQEWSQSHGGKQLEKLVITLTDCVTEEDMQEIASSGLTMAVQCSFLETESEDEDDGEEE